MRLDQLVYTKYPDSVQMREAARNYKRRLVTESRIPQTGAYWWVPLKSGKWEILPFYDSDYDGNTMHDRMWREVLDKLSIEWNKPIDAFRSIRSKYTALPRGRVSRAIKRGGPVFNILHGSDGPGDMSRVLRVFNLTNVEHVVMDDEHEAMIPGDPEALQRILGIDLGLRGRQADFNDYDEFDDVEAA